MKRVIACCCALAFAGCAYRGGKVVEGTDLAIGINVPMTEGALQIQALNFLSGFRLGVDQNANLHVVYTVAESNQYFGVVNTHVVKTIDATVEPVETKSDEKTEVESTEATGKAERTMEMPGCNREGCTCCL